jgi:MATE family multidrug resistance protein
VVLRQGVLLGAILGLVSMTVLLLWAHPLLRVVGVAPELASGGAAVVRAMALAYPAQFVMSAASYFLEGASRPRRVAVVNLVMLPLNGVLAWAWTVGALGLPALGAVGAALATALASWLGCAAMLVAVWTLPDAERRQLRDISPKAWRSAWRGVPVLARFGAVPAIGGGLELAGFSYLIALSTQLGAVTAGAFQAVFSLHNFTFALALGLGSAAGVRVGNAVGAGNPGAAFARALLAVAIAAAAMAFTALLLWLSADHVVGFASSEREIVRMAATLLALLAPFMLFDGVQVVFTYALRSLGDQVAAGINGVFAFFFVTGSLGWWLMRTGWGGPGLIYAIGIGMVAAALLQGGRFLWITRRASRS